MNNRTRDQARTANKSDINHSTKSMPSIADVLPRLLNGEKLHHQDFEQHALRLTISDLRHKYCFGNLIQCPRASNHPLKNHYFIATSDIDAARHLAKSIGFI
jgi:hypothetical protein